MKSILLLVVLLFSCISYSQYIPMLDENNIWSVDTYFCPFSPPNFPTWTVTEQNTINGTIEIDGIIYKQIYRDDNVSCLLREENGVVYKYFTSGERVLFDMNFDVGDTYSIMFNSGFDYPFCSGDGYNVGPTYIEVSEVDIIFLAGEDRKIITFVDSWFPNSGDVLHWIEGIGTYAGLGHTWAFLDITCGSALACFETNGVSYYMNGATSCDNTTLGVNDLTKEKIILYPNPVTDRSILQFPEEAEIDKINIYDITGKLIKEESIIKDYYVIDSMQFSSGIYFYQIFSEDKLIKTDKFIVK